MSPEINDPYMNNPLIRSDEEIQAEISALKKSILKAIEQYLRLARRRAYDRKNPTVSVYDLSKILFKYTAISKFAKKYTPLIENTKQYDSFSIFDGTKETEFWCKVPLKNIYIDLTYQRITDLLKCFENIIIRGCYDCSYAKFIDLWLREENVFACSDGAHRIIMSLITGRKYVEAYINYYPDDVTTTEERIKWEAANFRNTNDLRNPISKDLIYKSGLIEGREEDVAIDKFIGEAGLDVVFTHEGGWQINKVGNWKSYIYKGNNAKLGVQQGNYRGFFTAKDVKEMADIYGTQMGYDKYGFNYSLDGDVLRSLARVYYSINEKEEYNPFSQVLSKSYTKAFFRKRVNTFFKINGEDSVQAYKNLVVRTKSGNEGVVRTHDFGIIVWAFNLNKKQSKELAKFWEIDSLVELS